MHEATRWIGKGGDGRRSGGAGEEERGCQGRGGEPCSTARGSKPALHRAALDTDEEEEKKRAEKE